MILKISIILILMSNLLFAQSFRSKINEGNEKYNEENYEEALNSYQDALLDNPQNAIAHFNRGDALYKLEKLTQEAQELRLRKNEIWKANKHMIRDAILKALSIS